jgi:CelD/BcsL family acetyltransferase involved in cellulose biosynthesis
MLKMGVYHNFDQLQAVCEQWDRLALSAGSEIFLTYDWCRIWWKYYGKKRELNVLVFQNENDLVGIVPLFYETIWLGPMSVKAARLVGSDHMLSHFSLPLLKDYMKEIVEELSDFLRREKWDVLHLGPIAGLYEHRDALKEALQQFFNGSYSVFEVDGGVQTYYKLADTWTEYFAGLKKQERKRIRRVYRMVDGGKGILTSELASMGNLDEKFQEFVRIHQKYWRGMGKGGHFEDWPDSFEFHREVAHAQLKQNRLMLLEVRLSEHCYGYKYGYRFGKKHFEVLPGRLQPENMSHINLGRLMFAEEAKSAIRDGVRYIDSMRGRYEYKLRLGGELFHTKNIYVVRKRISVMTRVRLFRILARLLNLFYYRIWFLKITPRLLFRPRPLWKIWIRTNVFS